MTTKTAPTPTALTWETKETGPEARYSSSQVEHGISDTRGRSCGSFATIETSGGGAFVGGWDAVNKKSTYSFTPDGFYLVRIWTTRNGGKFGAIPRGTRDAATTLEGAKAFAAKKLIQAGARVRKDASKTGGVYFTAGERRNAKAESAATCDGLQAMPDGEE